MIDLDLEALRAIGIPERLLKPLLAPPSPLRERPAKLDINFASPREKAVWEILCFLEDEKPTVQGRKFLRTGMEAMAIRQEARIKAMLAQLSPANSGSRQARGKA